MKMNNFLKCLSPVSILSSHLNSHFPLVSPYVNPWLSVYQVRYAKRKGVKMLKEQKRRKAGLIPQKVEEKRSSSAKFMFTKKSTTLGKRYNVDEWMKTPPIDDVYQTKFYKRFQYKIIDAINCIRKTHDPTIYNSPNSLVHMSVELDLSLPKKNRFMDSFSGLIEMPYAYENAPKNKIIAISPSEEDQVAAIANGAVLAGYKDIISQIKTGEITKDDYNFIVCSADIQQELVPLRGILRNNYPSVRNGTMSLDVPGNVTKHYHGFAYTVRKDNLQLDFGLINIICGKLSMKDEELEENIKTIFDLIEKKKNTAIKWPFITRAIINSPPSSERYDLDVSQFLEMTDDEEVEAVSQ